MNRVLPWKLIGAVLGVVIGAAIANLEPPQGLSPKGLLALGVFVCAIIWWMIEILPDYMTAILMCCAWTGFGAVKYDAAFISFAGATLWLLIGALGLAVGVAKCGLLRRIALFLMGLFPLTFKGQTLALMVTGTVLSPLIPSSSAKIAVVAPFAVTISDSMGFERKSPGAGGIFSSMYISLGCAHPLFLSASFLCYAALGLLPKDVQAQFTWTTWFINALPWGLTLLILGYFTILFLYRPESGAKMTADLIKEQRTAQGPMTIQEKIVAIILVITLLLWMTEKIHGINSAIVALVSMGLMQLFNVTNRADFRSEVAWDAIVFVGCILNISAVFKETGVDKWISQAVGPYIVPLLSENIFVFFIILSVAIYLIRLVIASQFATITIFMILLLPLLGAAGINPWVMVFVCLVAINVWLFMYQNVQYLVAFFAAAKGEMVSHKQMVKLSIAYMVISIIGLVVSIPVWKMTGLLK